jgi:hypothetical protein
MYILTLTYEERKAIDWIGDRYSHGYDLFSLLRHCFTKVNDNIEDWDWSTNCDITFTIPENVAWQIRDIIEEDNGSLACFSEELKLKLWKFAEQIV